MIFLLLSLVNYIALTDPQTDELIKIFGKLVESVPMLITMLMSFLGLLTSIFLAVRQWLNKTDTDKKIAGNTEISVKAFDAANSHNEKIATTAELAKEAAEVAKQALEKAVPQKVEVVSSPSHPVHVTPE